jgi:nicotinamidase-related amidase
MQHAFGLTIPRTLAEVCNPRHTALLVYDMQMGIVQQAPALKTVIPQVSAVLEAARAAKLRTFFSRHMSLPSELMGISQLRTAMTWQKTAKVTDVKPRFLRDSPGFTLLPEMQPLANEMVFDKLGMSFFAGTPLDMVLRDCGINALIIVGMVLEIGIMPTVANAIELGYIPMVIADACGSVDKEARRRALDDIDYTGVSITTDTATICDLLRRAK